ncbi:MAG TPA: amylo-alpha-1,6-glucosidase [Tepidisphaeraceae bacterium]|jgi:predicted glycogen debranching enzyme|nr:amylo-alpha-1,6-glucosidase [Tepidisphaeraceae bacterium]
MRLTNISGMNFEGLIEREWLATNGQGGYACSTLCGLNTRKYHGLLVAAMSPPVRRMVLLSHVEETVWTSHGEFALSCNEYPGAIYPRGFQHLRAFNVDPFPRWAFQGEGFTIEKSLHLMPGENTVCLSYSLLTGEKSVTLEIKALLALRGIHELMYQWNSRLAAEVKRDGLVQIPASSRTPEVFLAHDGEFRSEPHWYLNTIYRRENERGYSGLEDLWKPGSFRWTLAPGQTVHLACSMEPLELKRVCTDLERARENFDRHTAIVRSEVDEELETLLKAADAFVVSSPAEPPDQGTANVISQYPWSSPSGRTALIGFNGLFLVPGRLDEGRSLLLSLAGKLQDGLIPTDFPESGAAPQYNGADTSLWFINAVGEYFRLTDDEQTADSLLPTVEKIIKAYREGTRLGIFCDADGLVGSRAPGVPTSWMDAKVGDWVVTPRQGRTVELNALWFNALRTASSLASRLGKSGLAQEWETLAQKTQASFNRIFWNAELNCCYDVVEDHGSDPSIRPNQILAISLPYPVLASQRNEAVVRLVLNELLTPMGLRTLSRRDPAYQGRYGGNVVSRDRTQHQGSAYPWLLGPLAAAYVRTQGRNDDSVMKIHEWLKPCLQYISGDGVGQLCELCDGDAPHASRGAIASALSVAEILRCYANEVLGIATVRPKARPISVSAPGKPVVTSTPK